MTTTNTTTASRAPDRKKAVRYHWAVYLGTEGADHEVRPRGFFDAFRHNYHGWAVWVGPLGLACFRSERWVYPSDAEAAHGAAYDTEALLSWMDRRKAGLTSEA